MTMRSRLLVASAGVALASVIIMGGAALQLFSSFSRKTVETTSTSLGEAGKLAMERGVAAEIESLRLLLDRVENNVRQLEPLVSGYVMAIAGRHQQWNELATRETGRIVESIGRACAAQQTAVERQLSANLRVAEDALERAGEVSLGQGDIPWKAQNQFSHEVREVRLPPMSLGSRVVHPNADPAVPSPVVDTVTRLVGGTCTLFQRMNERGDMLRVATTVRGGDGRRAIGTYIPAAQPDGSANPVIATVLKGETFRGRAFVVDSWCIAAYKPLRDAGGKIIGMLYVGVKELEDSAFVRRITDERIGAGGYTFILDSKGVVLAHPRAELVGKDIVKDIQIPEFQPFLASLKSEGVQQLDYTFEGRKKFVFATWFKPWDWVVCTSGYWDDIAQNSASVYRDTLVSEMANLYRANRTKLGTDYRSLYPQIRFIDRHGQEIFKVVDGQSSTELRGKAHMEWFKMAARTPKGEVFFSKVEMSENLNRSELRVALPIYHGETFEGLAVLNVDWDITRDLIAKHAYGETGYPYLIDGEGFLVTHPKYRLDQRVNIAEEKHGYLAKIVREQMLPGKAGFDRYTFEGVDKFVAFAPVRIGAYSYSMAVTIPVSEYLGLARLIESRASEESARIVGIIVVLMGMLGLTGGGIGLWLAHRISGPIRRTVEFADAIAQGDLPKPLPAVGGDEIAALEASFNRMIETSREIVVQTNALARGDYTISLEPRSDKDDLAHSLIAMTKALKEFKEENDRRNWLKTGMTELNTFLRGDRDPVVVAGDVITYLARYLGASVGTLFLAEGEQLRFVASYAYTPRVGHPQNIRYGEGLVGQCAKERKPISVDSVPADYVRVESSLGSVSPRALVLVPLVLGEEVAGVVELGAFDPFPAHHMELLTRCGEAVAAALLSGRSRAQISQLLEETQQQSEELQQSNEELEEHTQALEKGQAEIRRQNEELEKARTELTRKADDLERASRYKSEFLANMSHELRTPLNSMLILSHLLANNKEGKIPEEKQREFAETIHKAGADLLNLINDILDLSKIEAGKMEFHFEEVNVPDMLHGMEQMLRHGAEAKGLEFVVRLAASAPEKIRTDVRRLQQVLKNLIGNAIKFTERGSVTLEASSDQVGASPFVVLRVTDTGVGIPADKRDMVFEAFKQADGSTNRKYGGTGLGLSISRELARHLGGEVFLERSEVGVGSTFTLRLPVAEVGQSSSVTPVARISEPARLESVRNDFPEAEVKEGPCEPTEQVPDDRDVLRPGQSCLLVVEDDPAFARILVDLVRSRGFSALWAGEGQAALQLAKAHGPKGIFLDVMLPGMDGWSVMRHLKDEPATRHIPVHFISCLDRSMEGLRMGAVGYLTKPVTVDQLQEAISRIERATSRGMRQLLVVEDNEAEAAGILELLAGDDVQAITASSGAEAIRLLGEKRFDCVVLDLGLTDMSGFDLLEHVRSKPELAALPVIIHTGRDLTKEEEMRLRKYTESIIVKGAKSPERLLDEATLFLHLVEENMPEAKQRMLRMAHDKEMLLEGKKVLLVDDDIRNVYSLTSVLEGLGMVVIPAMDGKEALDKLEEAEVDLVLMDIMMPVMDGYEATKAIRAQERFKTLPVIALTAKAMKGDRERCIAAGATDYLAKPVDVNQLITLLRIWIKR